MKLYQIVHLEHQTCGHGDSADVATLASKDVYSVDPYPLFIDKHKAEQFIETEDIWLATVIELEVV
jgi:hypothetical protein